MSNEIVVKYGENVATSMEDTNVTAWQPTFSVKYLSSQGKFTRIDYMAPWYMS